mgnify:CR=1 FL=1
MGAPASLPRIDYATYLQIERDADQRHEWLDGEIFAMSGGTIAHARLAGAMIIALGTHAQKCGCAVLTSDAKLRVLATGLATYPDVSLVCGPIEYDPEDRNNFTNPAVLVAVLSDSTEAYDRGAKFRHYREVPSLRDYVLVSQHERRVEVYSRDAQGHWVLREARAGGSVPLAALDAQRAVDALYDGVELSAPTPRATRTS